MVEIYVIATILIFLMLVLKRWNVHDVSSGEKESTPEKYKPDGIIGKSNFVLTSGKHSVYEPDSSGKMDVELPLEYEPDISFIEEQEELEQLGFSSQFSSDITFEEMMEMVNEVESMRPQNPTKAGKLLYENDNTDWVEKMASTSPDHQKRIVALIDLHLGSLVKNEKVQVSDDGLEGFNVSDYC